MTILVTGATGFLGSALVNRLLHDGHTVRILARDAAKAHIQFGTAVLIVEGNITDALQVRRALENVEIVFHLAGQLYAPHIPVSTYRRVHVEGTQTLLTACEQVPTLQRIVHCSTTGVFGVTGINPVKEDANYAPTNPYEETKATAEILALVAGESCLPMTVVRPALVYGPGDLHLLGLFRAIAQGYFRVIANGQACLHPIYVDDMINAFLLCAWHPRALGHAYTIAGEKPVTIRALAETIARALHTHLPHGNIPRWLALLAADIFAITPGLREERAPLTRSRVDFLTHHRVYSIKRACTELGYQPEVELEEGIGRTVAWYQKHGFL